MMHFHNGVLLGFNPNYPIYPNGILVEYLYQHLIDSYSLEFQRSSGLSQTLDQALCRLKPMPRQSCAVIEYRIYCEAFKNWCMGKRQIKANSVSFYKPDPIPGNPHILLGTKILSPEVKK